MTIWIIKAFFICGIYVQNRMKNEDQNCPSFCSPTVSIRIDLLIDNRLMCAAVVLIPAIWYCGRGFMKALALLVWDEKQWGTDWIQWIDQRILDRGASSLPPREHHHHHKMFGRSKKCFGLCFCGRRGQPKPLNTEGFELFRIRPPTFWHSSEKW